MPYLTAGDPDMAATGRLLPALEQAGASICEIGVPFSDPVADGPVIQASMTHALDHGATPGGVLDIVKARRDELNIGLVAMMSFSIMHRMGVDTFIQRAKAAGLDGFIIPDLPVEEAGDINARVLDAGLICSFLIAPTSPASRVERLAKASSGFVYLLARAGITGERNALPADLPENVQRIRNVTDLPVAVGFGVSDAEQVRDVVAVADAAIVGSAIMRRVADHRDAGTDRVVEEVSAFVRELVGGLPAPAGA